jgi:uncharacterized protein DUF5681
MSRVPKRKRSAAHGGEQSRPGAYEVGYGRPPKKTQFRSGQSGNPKGRPKGAKNEATLLREIMARNVEIREGGRARKISVLAAILLKFAESALKGDARSATFLLNRYGQAERDAPPAEGLSQDDRQLLDSYIRDFKARTKGTK